MEQQQHNTEIISSNRTQRSVTLTEHNDQEQQRSLRISSSSNISPQHQNARDQQQQQNTKTMSSQRVCTVLSEGGPASSSSSSGSRSESVQQALGTHAITSLQVHHKGDVSADRHTNTQVLFSSQTRVLYLLLPSASLTSQFCYCDKSPPFLTTHPILG